MRRLVKGVKVIIESTGAENLDKCYMVKALNLFNEQINLNFDWLVISVDVEKTLVSYFTKAGELIEGLWISNILLSDWFYNGMFYEILHRYQIDLFNSDKSKKEIYKSIKEFHKNFRHNKLRNLNKF